MKTLLTLLSVFVLLECGCSEDKPAPTPKAPTSTGPQIHPSSFLAKEQGPAPKVTLKALPVIELGKETDLKSLTFSLDGKKLYGCIDKDLEFAVVTWSFPEGKVIREQMVDVDGVVSPDGKVLANGDDFTGEIRIWDIQENEEKQVLPGLDLEEGKLANLKPRFSRDGKRLCVDVSLQDGLTIKKRAIAVWSYPDLKKIADIEPEGEQLRHVGESPSADLFTFCKSDPTTQTVNVFDTSTESLRKKVNVGFGIESVTYREDGKLLAAQMGDTIRIHEVDSGNLVGLLKPEGNNRDLTKVLWSPDGEWMVGAGLGDDRGIEMTTSDVFVWSVPHQAQVAKLDEVKGDPGAHWAFSPEGRYLLQADAYTHVIRIWEIVIQK